MFTFLLVLHAIIAALLVVVILMQRSEGGGLTGGGSPAGLMSARGAADFLTRATTILATLFIALSVVLAVYAARGHSVKIDPSLAKTPASPILPNSAPVDPNGQFGAGARSALAPASNATAPVGNSSVPLQQ
jgi:preprotein translocase subunit SecG